jgi:hypothetical protein
MQAVAGAARSSRLAAHAAGFARSGDEIMRTTHVSALLAVAIAAWLAPSTCVLAVDSSCERIEAKYSGNVRWCEQTLGKCARGAEETQARRGRALDSDQTREGQACNRDYDDCMQKSETNRETALAQAGCPK